MMSAIFLLLAITVVFVLFIGVALFWAVFSGQFDDVQKNAVSILEDNDSVNPDAEVGAQPPQGREAKAQ